LGSDGAAQELAIHGIPYKACAAVSSTRSAPLPLSDDRAGGGSHGHGDGAGGWPAIGEGPGAALLRARWRDALAAAGVPVEAIRAQRDHPTQRSAPTPQALSDDRLDWITAELLGRGGPLDRHAAFTRTRLVAELAPRLYGYEPAALDRAVDAILDTGGVVRLEPLEATAEPVYGLAHRYGPRASAAGTSR
jgi:hypothetical protein